MFAVDPEKSNPNWCCSKQPTIGWISLCKQCHLAGQWDLISLRFISSIYTIATGCATQSKDLIQLPSALCSFAIQQNIIESTSERVSERGPIYSAVCSEIVAFINFHHFNKTNHLINEIIQQLDIHWTKRIRATTTICYYLFSWCFVKATGQTLTSIWLWCPSIYLASENFSVVRCLFRSVVAAVAIRWCR